jgi:DNA-binding response OmpR family regulator
MAAQVVITLADLETAIPLDKALEAVGVPVELVASADEGRAALSRHQPLVLVLTGAVHEGVFRTLAERAREMEIAVLALLEPTDSDGAVRTTRLGATEVLTKPVDTE